MISTVNTIRSCEILVPFAVHTAKFGYDWSNIPDGMSRAELDACYRAAIAKKPEYLEVGEIISGVAETDGRRFVYSIQIAEAWDANGRNAEYGAFAFLPTLVADRLYVTGLLQREEFRTPSRMPPKSVPCKIVHVPPVVKIPFGISTVDPSVPPSTDTTIPAMTSVAFSPTEPSEVPSGVDWFTILIWVVSAIAVVIALVAAV